MKSCRGLAKGGAVAWNTWPSRRRPQRSLTIWCRRKKKQGGVYPELAHGNSRRGRIAPRLHFVSLGEHFLAGNVGAEEGTRTPTAFRPPAPKAGASANSATSAMSASIASPLGGRAAEPSRLPLPGPVLLLGFAAGIPQEAHDGTLHEMWSCVGGRRFVLRGLRHAPKRGCCCRSCHHPS